MAESPIDPSRRNEVFDTSSLSTFFAAYCDRLGKSLALVDREALQKTIIAVEAAGKQGTHIYAIGNGGSAAIADHLCCDWTKNTHEEGHNPIATHSLSSNVALYSAIANDFGFTDVFARQIDYFGKPGDVLLAISSSGNSENILRAVERAKSVGMMTIGLSGFSGGKLKAMADISVHVPADNYGVIEDAHQVIMHVIAQFITAGRLKG